MTAFYNEIDPYAAAWLGNLASEGNIAPGSVDTRSIVDLRPADVAGHAQCHFFAGVAGWSLALRLAGVPDDFPVWTGSCPCQPFSAAGQRKGFADERHLWPAWFDLIRQCRPAIVFGEQVEAAVRLGWLDAVFSDLEAEGYACAATVLGAHSVGAPHQRQRLWFVAKRLDDAASARCERKIGGAERQARDEARLRVFGIGSAYGVLADSIGARLEGCDARPLGNERQAVERGREAGDVADRADIGRVEAGSAATATGLHGAAENRSAHAWSDAGWLPCRDGKARPVEPGTFPLAHGIPNRVGRLRAYGNAIVPQVAASFIAACLGSLSLAREAA